MITPIPHELFMTKNVKRNIWAIEVHGKRKTTHYKALLFWSIAQFSQIIIATRWNQRKI